MANQVKSGQTSQVGRQARPGGARLGGGGGAGHGQDGQAAGVPWRRWKILVEDRFFW